MIQILPLTGIAEVVPGDAVATILADALARADIILGARDVLVITQKIVSKAEGRCAFLDAVDPGDKARAIATATHKEPGFVELVLTESTSVVRAAPHVLITRHRSGHVMANAGIDRSNIGPGPGARALLLPADSDASAASIRDGLAERLDTAPAIVIADSFGRPWRLGVTGVAIGVAGLPALIDRRGEADRDARPLETTWVAFADMIASAAALAMGEAAESVPAVLIRGLSWNAPDRPASALVRPLHEDLFQ